jgi:hypothetical protein
LTAIWIVSPARSRVEASDRNSHVTRPKRSSRRVAA